MKGRFIVQIPCLDQHWDGLPIPVEPEEWMAVFHIYGDESGKGHQGDYTSFCGYVAHISLWQQFAAAWNNCRFKWQVSIP